MSRILLFIFLFLIAYYVFQLFIKSLSSSKKKTDRWEPEELVQDPYCQTYIPKRSALKKKVSGKDYYFCKKECLENFVKNKKP
jgi:YHS domain-containing protein